MNRQELQSMLKYGAEKIFSANIETGITDEDIETLIARGEDATKQLNEKMSKYTDQVPEYSTAHSLCHHLTHFDDE